MRFPNDLVSKLFPSQLPYKAAEALITSAGPAQVKHILTNKVVSNQGSTETQQENNMMEENWCSQQREQQRQGSYNGWSPAVSYDPLCEVSVKQTDRDRELVSPLHQACLGHQASVISMQLTGV
ncbi:hypothetical protein PAMP_020993 [Pampus punctatissimus]